jgi:DNA-binding CsgD family transcriptional regulator
VEAAIDGIELGEDLRPQRAEGFFLVDAEQRVVGWSRGIEDILGVSRGEALGRRCYQLMRRFRARDPLPCGRDCNPLRSARRGDVAVCVLRREHSLGAWSLLHEPVATPEGELVLHRLRDASLDVISIRFLRRVLEAMEEDVAELRQAREAAYADNLVLTRRETEVLRLLAEGLDTRSVATRLSISYFTARNYIQSVLSKLNAHNRVEAVVAAQRLGLLRGGAQPVRAGR